MMPLAGLYHKREECNILYKVEDIRGGFTGVGTGVPTGAACNGYSLAFGADLSSIYVALSTPHIIIICRLSTYFILLSHMNGPPRQH